MAYLIVILSALCGVGMIAQPNCIAALVEGMVRQAQHRRYHFGLFRLDAQTVAQQEHGAGEEGGPLVAVGKPVILA